jgi:3-methylcrotonyl-CoA carboxylase alpha subunit
VLLHAGRSYALSLDGDENQVAMTLAGHFYDVRLEDERERAAHAAESATRPTNGLVTSIMPGIVVEILVAPGQTIEKGAPLLILSAMKMQNEIAAPVGGTVQTVHVATGQAVAAGAKLVTIKAS